MAEVTPDDVRLAILPAAKKSASVYRSVQMLYKSIFASAEESNIIDHSPCTKLSAKGGVPQKDKDVEYIKTYRLQMACQMLAKGNEPITEVASQCGLGSSSYFGKTFREEFNCTPLEYRKRWHNRDICGQQ